MEKGHPVKRDVAQKSVSVFTPGKMIMKYLQETKSGATIDDIVRHLSREVGEESQELARTVMFILENGTALGFLERNGVHSENLALREAKCRRRRRRSCCRRRGCRRRRRSCRRPRSCSRRKRRIRRRRSCRRRRRRC